MYRYARRWVDDNRIAPGVGAARLVGLTAIVTRPIDPDDTERQGRVSVNGEVWGALTEADTVLDSGTKVTITAVNGTRVVVRADGGSTPTPPPHETGAP
jgi:membrane protein implicated in regulation of membrane protease activity